MADMFDPYGIRAKAAGLGSRLGGGIRNIGSGAPAGSPLRGMFDDLGGFVEDLPGTLYEASPLGMGASAARAATDYLMTPRGQSAPAPQGQAPKADLARDAAAGGSRPLPNLDSFPGDGTDFNEIAPGVRLRGRMGSAPEELTGLRRSAASVRPLMAIGGSGGGPLSSADMKINSAAMGDLDDFFTNAPQAQRIQELGGRALEARAAAEADDPLALERGKAEIDLGRAVQQEAYKSQLQEGREKERRQAYGHELQQIAEAQKERQAQIDSMPVGPEREMAQRTLDEGVATAKRGAREKFGLGAGLNAAFADRTP